MSSIQREVGEWGQQTFPNATDESIVAHMAEEVAELKTAILANDPDGIREECADVYMMLLHLAHRHDFLLTAEAYGKLETNRQRTWTKVTPNGYVKHEESTHV